MKGAMIPTAVAIATGIVLTIASYDGHKLDEPMMVGFWAVAIMATCIAGVAVEIIYAIRGMQQESEAQMWAILDHSIQERVDRLDEQARQDLAAHVRAEITSTGPRIASQPRNEA